MDLEKLSTRARLTLFVVSLAGILVTALGVVLTSAIVSHHVPSQRHRRATGSMASCAARGRSPSSGAGLMIALLPLGALADRLDLPPPRQRCSIS